MTAETELSEGRQAPDFSWTARRNDSLGTEGRNLAFAFLFIVSVGIAAAFAVLGAWLILPFAGLEMVALFAAFRWIERHGGDYERIAIEGDRLQLEVADGGRVSRFEFNRCWACVVLDECAAPARLAVRYKGEEFRFGRHLDGRSAHALARDLAGRLRG